MSECATVGFTFGSSSKLAIMLFEQPGPALNIITALLSISRSAVLQFPQLFYVNAAQKRTKIKQLTLLPILFYFMICLNPMMLTSLL